MSKIVMLFPATCVIVAMSAASHAAPPVHHAAALQRVIDCRAIGDSAQRLACYDASVSAMETAETKKDIVVVDREQVRQTRKSLFGFPLPKTGLFGDRDDGPEPQKANDDSNSVTEVDATIKSARQDADGNWVVTLEDGAVWHQTEGVIALRPRPGGSVTIKRGALGSYVMRIGKQPGIKARREQ